MKALRTLVLTVLVLVFAAVAVVDAANDDAFKPKSIKGTWTGEWRNLSTGAEGDIVATVKAVGRKKMVAEVDLAGDPLGCGDPPPGKAVLKRGTGENTWNAGGFKVEEDTAGFGPITLSYRRSNNTITVVGNAPCHAATAFRLAGKLKESTLSANVTISGDRSETGKVSAGKG